MRRGRSRAPKRIMGSKAWTVKPPDQGGPNAGQADHHVDQGASGKGDRERGHDQAPGGGARDAELRPVRPSGRSAAPLPSPRAARIDHRGRTRDADRRRAADAPPGGHLRDSRRHLPQRPGRPRGRPGPRRLLPAAGGLPQALRLVAELQIDNRLEYRHIVLNDLPHSRQINLLVGVGGDVSESVYLPPRDRWMPRLEGVGKLIDRIRHRFEAAKDGILDDRLVEKRVTTPESVLLDARDALVNVAKARPLARVAAHKGTASCRIRRAARDG